MSKRPTEMTPEFSHHAGRVLASPYFDTEDDSKFEERLDEKDKLEDAIIDGGVYSYEDLDGVCKEIWDRAQAVLDEEDAAQKELDEMIAAGDPRVMEGYERFHEVLDTNPIYLVDEEASDERQ